MYFKLLGLNKEVGIQTLYTLKVDLSVFEKDMTDMSNPKKQSVVRVNNFSFSVDEILDFLK